MRKVLLVRFGEVYLKGLNRSSFLKILVDNVKKAVKGTEATVWLADSRIYVADFDDMDDMVNRVKRVFGLYSVSPAYEMEKDFETIASKCVELAKELKGTFKVLARRSDKRFPITSMDMAVELGSRILDANPALSVDVKKPQNKVSVEVRENAAYVYTDEVMAAGGLPMGTGGNAALLLSGGIDSPVAGYQIMRRGVRMCAIHFMSPPYTGELAREKVISLAKILASYSGGMRVYMVPFTNCQLEIHEKCPDELGTLITRRFMMRIANRLAHDFGAQAMITGESLGQVASQTMEALGCTDEIADMPVFRPLIGLDKLEIIKIAENIGTYETSILPYEDCCTVFTPRHPTTHPKRSKMPEAESKLDIDALVNECVENTEVIIL